MNTLNTSHLPILLVDDELEILALTKLALGSEGLHNVLTLNDSRQVWSLLKKERVSVLILDLMMPYLSGPQLLPDIIAEFPHIPVIIMTAVDDVETAVECLKNGAFDYLVKPVDPNRLVSVVQKALRMNSLENELSCLKEYLLTDQLVHAEAFSAIITCDKKMRALFQYAEVIAKTGQPVLITGETGVGKDLLACSIHKLSEVKGLFVTVNAAGVEDQNFADTLFGHKRGAFTSADQVREGLISRAAHGTLFLDEIGDLSQSSQIKLLRLLQSEEYYPLGSDVLKWSNARIIVATNHDLSELIAEGKFRKDLYYRLCAYKLHIPPLRERPDDVPLLLSHFVEKSARSLQKEKPALAPRLGETLAKCYFSGNVRELEAVVNDAVARDKTGMLFPEDFPCTEEIIPCPDIIAPGLVKIIADADPSSAPDVLCQLFGRFPTIDELEECMINAAMKFAEHRRGAAAALLGLTRQALYKRLKNLSERNATRKTSNI